MATPVWVTKPLTLVADNATEVSWERGYPREVRRKYAIEVAFPSAIDTPAERQAWFMQNIESGSLSSAGLPNSPFNGAPVPGTAHPYLSGLVATTYTVTVPSGLSKRVYLSVTYTRPVNQSQNVTDNGNVVVPFGSWGVQPSWTTAKLAGADYRGEPFMTKAGEVVNVQTNVVMYTLTRSVKQAAASVTVQPPTINKVATTVAGFSIAKHCGLRSQANVENTGEDFGVYPRILTEQIIYIPKIMTITAGTLVNPAGDILTLADVGSHDTLILHQGYREKVNGVIANVNYHDKRGGARMTFNALSVLDATGKHVEPGVNGVVTPYYMAFQVYPSATW